MDSIKAVLVNSAPTLGAPTSPTRGSWLRGVAWTLGSVILLAEATMHIERHAFGVALARGDLEPAERALDRLDWILRADSSLLVQLGLLAERSGQLEIAYDSFARSVEAHDNAAAHIEMARFHHAKGEWAKSADAFERSYALSAHFPALAVRLMGSTLARAGRPSRAREILERGIRDFPADRELAAQLRDLEARGVR